MASKKDIARKMRHEKMYNEEVFGRGKKGKENKHWFETGEHPKQKGKGSLNRASGKNEGDNMLLGRKGNEEARP